jgi:hypothetical protein
MLKPSRKAGGSPLINEGKAHGASAPKTKQAKPDQAAGRVLLGASVGASKKSTFKAPRSEGSSDATCCGYTKVS